MTQATATVTVELGVRGMTCASCAARLERALSSRSGVQSAEVHLVTERALIRVDPGTTLEALCEAIEDAGFEPRTLPKELPRQVGEREEAEFAKASTQDGRLLLLSAILSAPLVLPMFAMIGGHHVHLPPWLELVLATLVQFPLGARFYVAGYKAVRHGSGNMDLLVAIGTSAAYFFSVGVLLYDGTSAVKGLYFEASAVVITLVRLGKWLEAKAKRGTTRALRELASLQPSRVQLRRRVMVNTHWESRDEDVAVDELECGHIIVVRPGERIATDGVIVDGNAAIDESMLTGESEPVVRGKGDEVVGGSLNLDGFLLVQVSRIGSDSTLGRIINLVLGAQSGKAKVQRLVDRVSAIFVPTVLALSLVTFLGWYFTTRLLEPSLIAAVSVLVIACPCALGLATPTALVAGMGAAARAGILIRDIDTLERAHQVDMVVFDKTGTLTLGAPVVTEIESKGADSSEILKYAAAVEQGSLHPLGKAIVQAASERQLSLPEVEDFHSVVGCGVSATVCGKLVRVGSSDWLGQCGVITTTTSPARAESHVEVALDSTHLGTIYVSDAVRPTSAPGLALLHERGVRTMLLSGDKDVSVARFANLLGIDDAIGQVRPEDKQKHIVELSRAGRIVAMVGDGINDAPALAAADVGIALGSGTHVAVETAAIVLMRPDLRLVAAALAVAGATFAKIRQNLFWAFFYNCVGIPLAMAGKLSPVVAGLAMAASSVSVVTNSLLLRRWHPRTGGLTSRPS